MNHTTCELNREIPRLRRMVIGRLRRKGWKQDDAEDIAQNALIDLAKAVERKQLPSATWWAYLDKSVLNAVKLRIREDFVDSQNPSKSINSPTFGQSGLTRRVSYSTDAVSEDWISSQITVHLKTDPKIVKDCLWITSDEWVGYSILTKRQVQAFLLVYRDDLTLYEAGRQSGVSPGTVDSYLRRGIVKLRGALAGTEVYDSR